MTRSYPVPAGVQAAARRGLELRKQYGRGGTEVGLATARRLARGGSIPLEGAHGVRHIARYFPRHAGDNLQQKSPPSNGYIAWLLWGGNAGRSWSSGIVNSAMRRNPTSEKYNVEIRYPGGSWMTLKTYGTLQAAIDHAQRIVDGVSPKDKIQVRVQSHAGHVSRQR